MSVVGAMLNATIHINVASLQCPLASFSVLLKSRKSIHEICEKPLCEKQFCFSANFTVAPSFFLYKLIVLSLTILLTQLELELVENDKNIIL